MFCKKCGTQLDENVSFCANCGERVAVPVSQPENIEMKIETKNASNPLVGKEYVFVSSIGIKFFGSIVTRIVNRVTVSDDRLFIETTPKKDNSAPAVLFDDILGIKTNVKFPLYPVIMAVVSFVCGFASGVTFLLVPFFLWVGYNQKITITQRNGKDITMYTRSKKEAEQFINDMKQLTKIQ